MENTAFIIGVLAGFITIGILSYLVYHYRNAIKQLEEIVERNTKNLEIFRNEYGALASMCWQVISKSSKGYPQGFSAGKGIKVLRKYMADKARPGGGRKSE